MTALKRFENSFTDVQRLFEIHGQLTGGVQGRNRHLTKPLLKATIVMMCAAFEAYIEDACLTSAKKIAKKVKDPSKLPKGIKQKVALKVKENKNVLSPWDMAAEGWVGLYLAEVDRLCDGLQGGMNTPNAQNVRDLFECVLGIEDITNAWAWQGMTPASAVRKLNALVKRRGSIAHGKDDEAISILVCRGYHTHVKRLVEKIDEVVTRETKKLAK